MSFCALIKAIKDCCSALSEPKHQKLKNGGMN